METRLGGTTIFVLEPSSFHSISKNTSAGEFEKHEACWMGWPYDGGLWRDNAKPAQEQYANVAKAISQFEPLIMFADPSVSLPSV